MKVETIRHSLAHILAYAVQELYPGTKFGMGPAIENGFYYDFELPQKIGPEDLKKIQKKMGQIIEKKIKFKKEQVSKSKAQKIFKDQPYKLELLGELSNSKVTIYQTGDFVDLCEGPHVRSTTQIPSKGFRLTKIAGAYWKGSEENPMLTRIYGVAFKTEKKLKGYLKKRKEAQKRDHRKLGEKLDLFKFEEEIGAGLPLWLPKGTIIYQTIVDYLHDKLRDWGYQWVKTPHIGKTRLWKNSGHWKLYREYMYPPMKIKEQGYILKPMNCPFHAKIYQSEIRSYKDLPFRIAELGTVYRYEKSGVLHGLIRARGFTQDDAHLWCTPGQLNKELTRILKHSLKILKTFGFKEIKIYLSTQPKKYGGTAKDWEKATNCLKYVLKKLDLDYQIDPGEAAFYGPNIDLKIKDSLGREWQCSTIQVDFNLPSKFKLYYIDKKGNKREPILIHRALLGSVERFIGVLLEHYGGALPIWLSPHQVWVISVGSDHRKYVTKVVKKLNQQGIRAKAKNENETVSKKIRDGEVQKIPYLLVAGDKEVKKQSVRVRHRKKGDLGMMKTDKFIQKIQSEIEKKI